MTITLRKAVAGLVAAGALALASAAPAGASGPGTALCFPSNGQGVPQGGPGYAHFQAPPANERAFINHGCP
jgi:hypothetical protein